jgi:hypothetical protein
MAQTQALIVGNDELRRFPSSPISCWLVRGFWPTTFVAERGDVLDDEELQRLAAAPRRRC